MNFEKITKWDIISMLVLLAVFAVLVALMIEDAAELIHLVGNSIEV